jgi:hypothetical protein
MFIVIPVLPKKLEQYQYLLNNMQDEDFEDLIYPLNTIEKGCVEIPLSSSFLNTISFYILCNFPNKEEIKIEEKYLEIPQVKSYFDDNIKKILNDSNYINSFISYDIDKYIILFMDYKSYDVPLHRFITYFALEIENNFDKFKNKKIVFFLSDNLQFIRTKNEVEYNNFEKFSNNIIFYDKISNDYLLIYKIEMPVSNFLFLCSKFMIHSNFATKLNPLDFNEESILKKYKEITNKDASMEKIKNEFEIVKKIINTHRYTPCYLESNDFIYYSILTQLYKKIHCILKRKEIKNVKFLTLRRFRTIRIYLYEISDNPIDLYVEYIIDTYFTIRSCLLRNKSIIVLKNDIGFRRVY